MRFVYHPPADPADLREIYVYDSRDYDIARLVWQVCDQCRRGRVNKISIDEEWQRQSLGRRLIHRALRAPGSMAALERRPSEVGTARV